MKTYGLIVADNGSDMYVQGTYDTRWDNDVLNPAFASLKARDFEVVQLGWKPAVSRRPRRRRLLHADAVPRRRHEERRRTLRRTGAPPGRQRVFVMAGRCGVPDGPGPVSVNLTVTQPAAAGSFRAFPGTGPPPRLGPGVPRGPYAGQQRHPDAQLLGERDARREERLHRHRPHPR